MSKHLVWYNRSGQMMLAHVFMPASYSSAWFLPAVISVHGGGWREGFIEKSQNYNTAIVQNRQYVVFAPSYRLTAYGYGSPAMQSDIEDFINLVRGSASAFKLDPVRIGLFGASAGGHLVNLLGARSNMRCVSSLYPLSDLTASSVYNPANEVGVPLTKYVRAYASTDSARQDASPARVLRSTGTRFHIQHGTCDTVVPPSQTTTFMSAAASAGVSVNVRWVANAGHGFYDDTGFNDSVSSMLSFYSSCL